MSFGAERGHPVAKKVAKRKQATKKTVQKRRRPAVERPFPRVTLEDALRVPEAIKNKNNGKPFDTADVAKAVGLSARGNQFFYLTAGARDYGFTVGTRDTAKIELTELGRRVVYPSSAKERMAAIRDGLRNIDIFNRVLAHYGGTELPEPEYVSNTLSKEFGLDPDVHEDFVKLYVANCAFAQITGDFAALRQAESVDIPASSSATTADHGVIDVADAEDPEAPLCFVILPFTERHEGHVAGFFDEVLRQLIVPAAKECGFRVRTAKKTGSDVIQRTIVRNLLEADLVVADLTEHNPNVMFELGLRMAQEKPVAILKAEGTGPLFDVDHMIRVYSYSPCLWPSTVETDRPNIRDHIKGTWDDRNSGDSYLSLLKGNVTGAQV